MLDLNMNLKRNRVIAFRMALVSQTRNIMPSGIDMPQNAEVSLLYDLLS